MEGLRIIAETTPRADGTIVQEFRRESGGLSDTLSRWVIDTRDEGIRQALIALGWVAPKRPRL